MIVPRHYENLRVLHENTMPLRSYYIPASRRMDGLVHDRAQSDRIRFLNDRWKFRYFESIYDLNECFFAQDYDASSFDTLSVPSVWQMHGYDNNQYTNIKYPFPFDPPFVPHKNPCGAYVYDFEYHFDEAAPMVYKVIAVCIEVISIVDIQILCSSVLQNKFYRNTATAVDLTFHF